MRLRFLAEAGLGERARQLAHAVGAEVEAITLSPGRSAPSAPTSVGSMNSSVSPRS